jgi:hypothetical protein
MEKEYKVYLYKSPDCIRGWLAYVKEDSLSRKATFKIKVKAENGQKAKNKAITSANNGFQGVEILARNFTDEIWGIDKFPELKGV